METFLIEVPVPSMGATVNELTVIDIVIEPGAAVTKGQKLAELESDKSVFEFESPCAGTIRAVVGRAGDIISTGAPFLRIETSDVSLKHLEVKAGEEAAVTKAPAVAANGHAAAAKTVVVAAPVARVTTQPVTSVAAAPARTGIQWTPRASKIAQEAGLDPAAITDIGATGPGGRVSGDDVAAYLEKRKAGGAVADAGAGATASAGGAAGFDLRAAETVCIAGVGYAIPSGIRSNSEILKSFPDMTEEEVIKLTGIRERRYAVNGETATSLAVIAVQHALEQAKIDVKEIDGVIMATLIPDQPVPAMASALAKQLGIPRALAFDLNAACSGWLYALEVGRAFIRSGTAKKLIVVTAELLSRITNPKDHATAFLFGDGAGAAVLTDAAGGHRLARMALSGDADQFEAIQRPGGGAIRPFPDPQGKDQEDFFLQMNGGAVFKHAVIAFADQIEATLKRHNLKPDEVAWIVPHQANERILRAVGKRVGIPYEKFVVTIGKYGNTSAASVSMALGWAAEEEIFNAGDKIIFCSVGAGLTFAGGLLVW
ncbi:3-oxoacyl-ACP synthase [Nibricoccus aquaticus]|uniref:3-oxoacyl-ACP synthase n=1 Tax=Nibricoccus aquaticus TaxID=2576891 RepID=A0A290Q481_9BACT|nr:beta-ketoacyl-ACP synthase 3 [Nibricoccus aquaticus]ATC63304.1 3-oxoacyl-ACP synthase [Nibricoccus aquaticus]